MAKKENNVADKTSKKVIFWLSFVSFIFFFPFIGVFINEIKFAYICDLYTLGLDRKDFFSVWIALFGAIGIAINIYQNHRRTTNQDKQLVNQNKQLEKQAEQIQLQGTQLELQNKSQRDSRFSKGVELLGNANESARTGAAYSLFFLAKDYPEEFAKPVFEILCSHVRSITNTEEYKRNNNERPSNEIQSILDLLFRDDQSKLIFNGLKANLAYSYLNRAKLSEANLSEANLFQSNLSRANLTKVNLFQSNLSVTNLSGADLSGSDLSDARSFKANLSGTDLSGANLSKTILFQANLSEANLSEANLFQANLSNASLSESYLSGASLFKVILSGAILSNANLFKTNLSEADLSEADLSKAYLSEANLSNANLLNTNLTEANLSRADLSGAYLIKVKIDNTTFSVETILDGVDISQIDLNKIEGKINPKYLPNPDNETNADSQ